MSKISSMFSSSFGWALFWSASTANSQVVEGNYSDTQISAFHCKHSRILDDSSSADWLYDLPYAFHFKWNSKVHIPHAWTVVVNSGMYAGDARPRKLVEKMALHLSDIPFLLIFSNFGKMNHFCPNSVSHSPLISL